MVRESRTAGGIVLRQPLPRHTSAVGTNTKAEALHAQDCWRTDGRSGSEEGRYFKRRRQREDDALGPHRRKCANATHDDDRANRERHTDAQRNDRHIGLGVAAGLESLIPTIKQLHDRCAETDRKYCRDSESSYHCSESSTRISRALSSFLQPTPASALILHRESSEEALCNESDSRCHTNGYR